MRTSIFIIAIFILSIHLFAQAPQKMSYQAVLRSSNNSLVASTTVGMRISILQGSIIGTSIYTEIQTPISNSNGLVSIQIGEGTIVSGIFETIDWSAGPYFIKTETDITGGTNYTIIGTSQLLSVPYALYSAVADSVIVKRTYLYIRKKATVQSVANNTNTIISNYDSISSNNIALDNNTGLITFNRSGVYMITGHNSFSATNQGRKLIWFNCTSSKHPDRIACNEMSDDANRISTSIIGEFDAGDQISLAAYQNTGSSTDCPNTSQTFDEVQVNIEKIY